jgi:hypothetical protein
MGIDVLRNLVENFFLVILRRRIFFGFEIFLDVGDDISASRIILSGTLMM